MVLRIPLDFGLDASNKQGAFSGTLLKKSIEFIANEKKSTIAFNLSFVLLLAEVVLVLEKQSHKKDELVAYSFGRVK